MNANGYARGAEVPGTAKACRNRAVTLVEVIVTLCIASIAGALMLALVGNVTVEGPAPLGNVQRTLALQESMENITADARHVIETSTIPTAWTPATTYAAGDRVRASSRLFGHAYRCIGGGVSGATEPAWVTTSGASIPDGSVVWEEDGGQFDGVLTRLTQLDPADSNYPAHTHLTDGLVHHYVYGRYALRHAGFIRFVSDVETPVTPTDPDALLKIVLAGDTGEVLVGLFTATY